MAALGQRCAAPALSGFRNCPARASARCAQSTASSTPLASRSAISNHHASLNSRSGGAIRGAVLGRRGAALTAAAAPPSDVLVLDFDGVLVDSEPEVSMAGFRAAREYWPDVMTHADEGAVLQGLRAARPVQISGWETMIQARLLAEDLTAADRILADWPALQEQSLQTWGTDLADMRRIFEESRNKWMEEQEEDWLGYVRPYQNIVSTLKYTELPFYIVSSKAAHRVARVAERQLGVALPADSPRLFGGCIPVEEQKLAALRAILERPLVAEAGAKMHFVDDRLETVKAVAADAGLRDGPGKLQAYFADWGYSTDEDRQAAKTCEGVRSIDLAQFHELVKWGILMGCGDFLDTLSGAPC